MSKIVALFNNHTYKFTCQHFDSNANNYFWISKRAISFKAMARIIKKCAEFVFGLEETNIKEEFYLIINNNSFFT